MRNEDVRNEEELGENFESRIVNEE